MLFKCQTFLRNQVFFETRFEILILYISGGCTGASTLRLNNFQGLFTWISFKAHLPLIRPIASLLQVCFQFAGRCFCHEILRIRMHHQQIILHLKINHLSRVQWHAPVIQLLWKQNFGTVWVQYKLGVTVIQQVGGLCDHL